MGEDCEYHRFVFFIPIRFYTTGDIDIQQDESVGNQYGYSPVSLGQLGYISSKFRSDRSENVTKGSYTGRNEQKDVRDEGTVA